MRNGKILAASLFSLTAATLTGAFLAARADTVPVFSGPGTAIASPAPVTQIVLHGVRFAANSDRIESSSLPVLDYAASVVRRQPDALIYIAGQPATGRNTQSIDIAQRRVRAVASYLEQAGVAATRIAVDGSGEDRIGFVAARDGAARVIELKLTSSSDECHGCS
jgi:outer membrane protein OmpA-like peptidoglycan-associated protein